MHVQSFLCGMRYACDVRACAWVAWEAWEASAPLSVATTCGRGWVVFVARTCVRA